jgi:hypothetical protein
MPQNPTTQRDDAFQSWWLRARALIHKTDRRQFDTLVLLTAWSLWKQRNARVFVNLGAYCSPVQLADRIKEEFELWTAARLGQRGDSPRE